MGGAYKEQDEIQPCQGRADFRVLEDWDRDYNRSIAKGDKGIVKTKNANLLLNAMGEWLLRTCWLVLGDRQEAKSFIVDVVDGVFDADGDHEVGTLDRQEVKIFSSHSQNPGVQQQQANSQADLSP